MQKRGRKIVKIVDRLVVLIVISIFITMFFRSGTTISEIKCEDCKETKDCRNLCLGNCIRKGYDSITAALYKENNESFCECRCDHFLHSLVSKRECERPLINFGNSCCSDIDDSGICDKYEVLDLEWKERLAALQRGKCLDCNDNNPCTKDFCSIETYFACVNEPLIPCCGNNVCEESEDCLSCFSDCGKCLDVKEIKEKVDEFLGGEWSLADENNILYHSDNKGTVIVEFQEESNFLKTDMDFENFNFVFFPDENVQWKIKFLEKEELELITGKIKNRVGTIEDRDRKFLFQNVDIYCSPRLYIRLQPEWSYKRYASSYEEYKNLNKFDSYIKGILPLAESLIELCPIKKDECIECHMVFNISKDINRVLDKNYVFIEEKYNITNITKYRPFGESIIVINWLDKKVDEKGFYDFVEAELENEKQEINETIILFEKDLLIFSKLVDRIFRTYKKYHEHEMNRSVFLDNISTSRNNMLESSFGVVHDYKITYRLTGADDEFKRFIIGDEKKIDIISKISILCRDNIVIDLYEESIIPDINLETGELIINLKNQIKITREELIEKAERVAGMCS